jgi:branched-chain amino acid transport system ATP-binding protein
MDGRTLDLTRLSTEEIVNEGIAMVGTRCSLLTVEENLLLGAFRPAARQDRRQPGFFSAFPS